MQIQLIENETTQKTTDERSGTSVVGKLLRKKREEKKLSLEEVCEILKIRKFFLESIEAGRLDQLPGSVYTIGFVKVYSHFLGVDFEEISSYLVELIEVPQVDTPLTTYHLPPSKNLLTRWSIGLSIFLVIVSLGYFYFNHERDTAPISLDTTGNETKEETPKPIETTKSQEEPQLQAQTDTSVSVIDESSLVTIVTTKETWIKIIDGTNQLVAARLLRPGTSYQIESRPGLLLTAGEADAIQIYLGNIKLSRPIPQNAGLLESFSLEAENLKTYIEKPTEVTHH